MTAVDLNKMGLLSGMMPGGQMAGMQMPQMMQMGIPGMSGMMAPGPGGMPQGIIMNPMMQMQKQA